MAKRATSAATPAIGPLTFVEMSPGNRGPAIEIALGPRIRVQVHDRFDATTLCRLLDVLEARL